VLAPNDVGIGGSSSCPGTGAPTLEDRLFPPNFVPPDSLMLPNMKLAAAGFTANFPVPNVPSVLEDVLKTLFVLYPLLMILIVATGLPFYRLICGILSGFEPPDALVPQIFVTSAFSRSRSTRSFQLGSGNCSGSIGGSPKVAGAGIRNRCGGIGFNLLLICSVKSIVYY
jgi:hypothetical protein